MRPIHKELMTTGILVLLLFIAVLIPGKGCEEIVDPELNMEASEHIMTPQERAERACQDEPYFDSCVRATLRNMGE